MNKWSDNVDYEITKKDWYRGNLDNKPDSTWTHTDGTGTLDAFEQKTTSNTKSLSVTISSTADAGEVITVIVVAKVTTDNELVGAIETEIEIRVEGNYEVQLILPQNDEISLDAGASISTSKYVIVKNFAKVSDLITVTAIWEIGGNDWTLDINSPIILDASGEKDIYITVKAPDSAVDNQAILKIRVTSGGDNTKYDEKSITFTVNSAANTAGPETESLDESKLSPWDKPSEEEKCVNDGDIKNADDGCNQCMCKDGEWICTTVDCDPDDEGLPAPSLVASVAAIGIIALRRRY